MWKWQLNWFQSKSEQNDSKWFRSFTLLQSVDVLTMNGISAVCCAWKTKKRIHSYRSNQLFKGFDLRQNYIHFKIRIVHYAHCTPIASVSMIKRFSSINARSPCHFKRYQVKPNVCLEMSEIAQICSSILIRIQQSQSIKINREKIGFKLLSISIWVDENIFHLEFFALMEFYFFNGLGSEVLFPLEMRNYGSIWVHR